MKVVLTFEVDDALYDIPDDNLCAIIIGGYKRFDSIKLTKITRNGI
jgi:hypothetical protein